MKVVAIIQARMGSTRLPGKVLMNLAGEPMLVRDVNRVQRARTVDEVLIATTTEGADDVIADLCHVKGWRCFRGNETDVLDRYYQAARTHRADIVVRITSDCPLIEPEVIDRIVRDFEHHQPEVDYASNILDRRTFPRGLDTEVMRFDVLERAWRDGKDSSYREHVTPYIYRNPHLFCLESMENSVDLSHLRWTVDTLEDLDFVQCIYNHFGHDRFSWRDVLDVLETHPQWQGINSHIEQKGV